MSGPGETTNGFTELVRRKIEERREGRSETVNAAAAAEARLRERAAPLMDALVAMVARLSRDPMFANAVGRPEVTFECVDEGAARLTFDGPTSTFAFRLEKDDDVCFHITLSARLDHALGRDFGGANGPKPLYGTLDRLDEFVVHAEDRIAELLADLYLSPAAHLVLGTGKRRDTTGRW